jgi:hypothetical protein
VLTRNSALKNRHGATKQTTTGVTMRDITGTNPQSTRSGPRRDQLPGRKHTPRELALLIADDESEVLVDDDDTDPSAEAAALDD